MVLVVVVSRGSLSNVYTAIWGICDVFSSHHMQKQWIRKAVRRHYEWRFSTDYIQLSISLPLELCVYFVLSPRYYYSFVHYGHMWPQITLNSTSCGIWQYRSSLRRRQFYYWHLTGPPKGITINHQILLHKLTNYGVRGTVTWMV